MNKKIIIPIIGLILCLLGVAIQLTDINNSDKLPELIRGRGIFIVIFGMLLSGVYLLSVAVKKK